MVQLTILKITKYGPWTLSLGSDREHQLQMLQASLYKDVQKLFSEKNSLVFLNRADEFFVITNGLTLDDHIEIQKELAKNFDLKLSMSIGFAETPFDANLSKEHNIYGFVNGKSEQKVTIIHFDVENLTSKRQNTSPCEISSMIFKLYSKMTEFFLKKNSLTFFMGGDNFMVVSDEFANKYAKEFIALAKKELEVTLNCGIGTGKTAREAVKLATKSLDTIRQIRDSGKEKPEIYELSCF
ncbi:MAG: GTP cyclohydrolase IIa [Nitrosopumilales archaeon]|nr:GTP cyclohydrolase IIa [Nitrosopumilales archaeon]